MIRSLEEICEEVQALPNESKIILAERLVASIEDEKDPLSITDHLEEVKRRRDEIGCPDRFTTSTPPPSPN